MRDKTKKWVTLADKDLHTAGLALRSIEGPFPVTSCLHCQQSAEKYLKAFLQEYDIAFSGQHHLAPLLDACAGFDESFESLRAEITSLDRYSVSVNYPKAEVSIEFIKEALSSAQRVKEFVRSKLE